MNNRQIEILEALILTDGYLGMSSNKSKNPRFILPSIHKEFITYVANEFSFNNQKTFSYESKSITRNNKTRHQFNSNSTEELVSFYSKWYIDKVKVIPTSFKLTPLIVLIMYLSDGCISVRKNNSKHAELKICVENFTEEEVVFLQSLFKDVGINFSLQKRTMKNKIGYRLYIAKKQELINFFNYVEKLPDNLQCFKYKFPTSIFVI